MPNNIFLEAAVPEQKLYNGVPFPTVLVPDLNDPLSPPITLPLLADAIRHHKPWLESLLHESGAILFRGFPVVCPSDFNDVVEAFDFPEMPYVGGGGLRTQVIGRVYTANESPPDQHIRFHHEMAYAPEYPSKVVFFCEVEPGSGGETPLVQSHVVYERMKERYPEFVTRLEEHGLTYARIMADNDEHSSAVGRSWKATFSTDDKAVAEQRAAKVGMTLEWMENAVYVRSAPLPAVRFDESRQRKTWFNSMTVVYGGPEFARENGPDKFVAFGDGKRLPPRVVYDCLEIMDEECVAIPWRKGDFLLVDNLAVLHARRPLVTQSRRILAALCK